MSRTVTARTEFDVNDCRDYRTLLDQTRRGLESANVLVHAIHSSEAAQHDRNLRELSEAARALLLDSEAQVEKLWGRFQRLYVR